ncbi:MAG: aminotransferase class I/II-fold pyridoxal phosphate-dependent enzyme [Planctomycetota bacterium]
MKSNSPAQSAVADCDTSSSRLYLSPPHMSVASKQLLNEAFDSNWVAPVGPDLTKFEQEFAEFVGTKHAVAVSSGTAALHLAVRLAGVAAGDAVPVSTLTFVAPANAIVYAGAEPVFVDSNASTWNMDPGLLREAIMELRKRNRSVKAVVVVDVLGACAEYQAIREITDELGLLLIEDAAESLGATCGKRNAGTLGQLSCFSFNGNKMMTTSGGGMLCTNRGDWAERARHWATQAREDAVHYEHAEVGYNYRMSNLLAAIGRGQLTELHQRVGRRREIYRTYVDRLTDQPGIKFMPDDAVGRSSCWLTCMTVDAALFGSTREEIRQELERCNIESRPCWKPMHAQPLFSRSMRFGGDFAEHAFETGLCLPSGSQMSDQDLQRVVDVIRRCRRTP